MSTLTLVRHGQASFLTEDYDRLSALGVEQSRALGAYWVERGVGFDQAYVGPLRRHAQTAAAVMEVFEGAGVAFPEPVELPGLSEFKWDELAVHALEALRAEETRVAALAAAFEQSRGAERPRAYQRLFEEVCKLWVQETHAIPEVERWSAFEARVKGALEEMTEGAPRKARVVAFTSGGPVAVACQRALDLRPEKALELIWTLRNCALAEFFFTPGRFSLSRFNEAPHLHEPSFWTYR